jgi:FkbM family methyltransferase
MKVFYGIEDNKIDVTDICLSRLKHDNIIIIPIGDGNRANFFTDPLPGILKYIFVMIDNTITKYNDTTEININILTNQTYTSNNNEKISNIHNQLKIKYGSFQEELPEQKMAVRFLTGNEKVLEIGGNIGRNSLVIASIVKENHLVTLETDPTISNQLQENKNINNLQFYIENSALSKRKLIQRGWDSKPSDTLEAGYQWVNIITFDELQQKYNLEFDTLVLDCEGAFYYILMDMPEILNNIQLIIMENDYWDMSHKKYVDNALTKHKFSRIYYESGGWGPCTNNFFEVWKKI